MIPNSASTFLFHWSLLYIIMVKLESFVCNKKAETPEDLDSLIKECF